MLGHRQPTVLIVEDYPDGAESTAQLLTLAGFDTRLAHSIADALQAIADFTPNVVILDIQLPDGSGYDLAKKLRRLLVLKPVFVAITGFSSLEETSRREGIDHHFLKPADPCVLIELLRRSTQHLTESLPIAKRIRALKEEAEKIAERTRQLIAIAKETRQLIRAGRADNTLFEAQLAH